MTTSLLFAALWCYVGISAPSVDSTVEIRDLLLNQQTDWNRGDLDAFTKGYWNSPELVFYSGGEISRGYVSMRERYQRRYQSDGKEMGSLAFSGIEVELLGGDSALARGRWQLSFSDGKTAGGLFSLILRKFPEGWRIVHDHSSSDTKN